MTVYGVQLVLSVVRYPFKTPILDISMAQRVLKTPMLDLDETINKAIATRLAVD
jgi:hypothetical protein